MNISGRLITILIVAVAMVFTGCKSRKGNAAQKAEEVSIPADVLEKYMEDAHRLALRELITARDERGGVSNAKLPEERVNFYLENLKKIYRLMKDDPEVPDMTHIHTFGNPNMQQVTVLLEEGSPIIDSWSKGRTTTGNLQLNQVMSDHQLKVEEFRNSSIGPMATLSSALYLNTLGLSEILTQMDGIEVAEQVQPIGDGNDISSGAEGKNALAIRYSVGRGDCPSGCIYRKYWVFYVSPEGEISYQGTRGELPEGEETEEGE